MQGRQASMSAVPGNLSVIGYHCSEKTAIESVNRTNKNHIFWSECCSFKFDIYIYWQQRLHYEIRIIIYLEKRERQKACENSRDAGGDFWEAKFCYWGI